MKPQIPWLRVLIEGVVIVGSILLAFGIDAWWDGRQERTEEQDILSGLLEDFQGNREILAAVIESHSASQEKFQVLQTASAEGLATLPQESLEDFLRALYESRTFDPFQGTLEATLSAGKLGLLRDLELRVAVGAWVRASADLVENATELRSTAQRVRYALERYGGPFAGPGPPRTSAMPRIDGATLDRIRMDDSIMGMARTKQFSQEIYLVELVQLRTLVESVLTLIDRSRN